MTDVETISTSHPITKNQLGGLDSHKMNPILYFVTLPPAILGSVPQEGYVEILNLQSLRM